MAAAEPYILFELAGTAYAVPSAAVERMEMVEHVTPVPNAPGYVDGVVFSRGRVVPAVNLRRRFGFAPTEYGPQTRLIVVSQGDRLVGLIVDSARSFVTIAAGAVQPPPEGLATSGNYLAGGRHRRGPRGPHPRCGRGPQGRRWRGRGRAPARVADRAEHPTAPHRRERWPPSPPTSAGSARRPRGSPPRPTRSPASPPWC